MDKTNSERAQNKQFHESLIRTDDCRAAERMKYRIEINPKQKEDILISARQTSEILDRMEALLKGPADVLYGYSGQDIVKLGTENVYCFFTEGNKVFASAKEGKYQVRERLYSLEELYPDDFLKVNQSCLVNISQIRKFDVSIGGSLVVILKNGYRDYVSRRQMRSVKERLGI
ncbi:MAG: LytTR family transcriptional regulator [Clostridia bacterium]|nr:LytTR family transcriptional regulator [Clostridia bacterium]